MKIKPIKTEADYDKALKEIDKIFDAKPDTPQGDKLDILVTLVEKYEEKHHPISFPDSASALKYYMESRGLTRKDLEPYLGSRARVSEILNRKRFLSLNMIRKLVKHLHIPAETLLN